MIDLEKEDTFPFRELPTRLAKMTGGKRIHLSTAHRLSMATTRSAGNSAFHCFSRRRTIHVDRSGQSIRQRDDGCRRQGDWQSD